MRWEPAQPCWALHRAPDGSWRPDWAEVEPGPVPVPTDDRLGEPAPCPWPDGSGRTVGHMLAWVNAELMRNAAEIVQLRLQHALRADGPTER